MNKKQLIEAMKLDNQENWDGAHEIVQTSNSPEACWIHAYLHRKEGDLGNAAYWYNRANRQMPAYSLTKEWDVISEFIDQL
jgi:hypothetical protein